MGNEVVINALMEVIGENALHLERYDVEEHTYPPMECSDEDAEIMNEWLFTFMAALEVNIRTSLDMYFNPGNYK